MKAGASEIANILDARAPLYAKADAVIDTSDKSPDEVVGELLSLIVEQGVRKTGT